MGLNDLWWMWRDDQTVFYRLGVNWVTKIVSGWVEGVQLKMNVTEKLMDMFMNIWSQKKV